jgi:hypothetical protein
MAPTIYQDQADAALALSHVVDPVAVPYIEEALSATTRVDPILIEGLRRIGSAEARAVLEQAATSSSADRAALARNALARLSSRD